MDYADQTLRLLTELGVLGPEDAEAIRQLLAEEPKPADGVGERTELSDRKFGTPIPAKATPILIDAPCSSEIIPLYGQQPNSRDHF